MIHNSVFAQPRPGAEWAERRSSGAKQTKRLVTLSLNSKVSACKKSRSCDAQPVFQNRFNKDDFWDAPKAFFSRTESPHSRQFKASGLTCCDTHPHWHYQRRFEEECGTVLRSCLVGEPQWEKTTLKKFVWCLKRQSQALETFFWLTDCGGMWVLRMSLLKNASLTN